MIDPEINFIVGDSDGSRAEMRFLCSEFKIVHHCNWKDYSKTCTTHIQEYLDILNHSCHQSFGQFYLKMLGISIETHLFFQMQLTYVQSLNFKHPF